jgi:hypothetical protein
VEINLGARAARQPRVVVWEIAGRRAGVNDEH